MSEVAEKAVRACGDYEQWAQEVARLTGLIRETVCPAEERVPPEKSCFSQASEEWVRTYGQPDDPYERPRTLVEIAEVVSDCGPCFSLVGLIKARKDARIRYGVAKRAVRHAGKLILAENGRAGEGDGR